MFVDSSGKAYNAPGFSKWVIRTAGGLFGGAKAPGVSLLRHGFCTALAINQLTASGAQREELALRMGHRAETQDRYRYLTLTPVAAATGVEA